jgi:hypothetical protein
MGLLADRIGLVAGFYAVGAFGLAMALVVAMLRRWAFFGLSAAPAAARPRSP